MFSGVRSVATTAARAAPLRATRAISSAAAVRASAAVVAVPTLSQQQQARSNRSRLMFGGAAALLASAAFATLSGAESAPAQPADQKAYATLQFVPLSLIRREKYNHNTDLFTFALPDRNSTLDLPVSSYIMTKCKGADGKDVIRPYTPINQSERGVMTLLVKRYDAGVMSKHMHNLKVGDTLEIKGENDDTQTSRSERG